MSELARRTVIWVFVAAWYAVMLWIAVTITPSGLLGTFAFPLVGAVILTSRPRNGLGRALLAFSLADLLVGAGTELTLAFGWPAWIESIGQAATWPFWMLLPTIALVFPTGRISTRFGRIVGWLTLAAGLFIALAAALDPSRLFGSGRDNPFAWDAAGPFLAVIDGPIGTTTQAVLALAVLVDVLLRWRRSSGVERLQFRWLVFALVLIVPLIAAISLLITAVPDSRVPVVAGNIGGVVLNLIPAAILIAVMRYGLYEINRIISRTVSYAVVTLLIAAVYVLAVTSLSSLLPSLPSVGVALATLAAAALFLPVLRRVQRGIDRRFDRERYDAEKVVEAFGEHLRVSTAPQSAADEFVEAVEVTLQPATVGLWRSGGTA